MDVLNERPSSLMKYESGRESFIYNDGKISGISD